MELAKMSVRRSRDPCMPSISSFQSASSDEFKASAMARVTDWVASIVIAKAGAQTRLSLWC